jgi:hypothetical protein
MRKTSILVLLSLVVLAGQAMAMEPDPILKQQLGFLARNFDCKGIAYASPMAPEHPTQATVTAAWTLGGYWAGFTYAEKKTAQNPMPFAVRGVMGYDPQAKKLVMGSADNMGGYTSAASDGWNGDALVFVGPWHMGTQTVSGRDTFMKKSATEMTHKAEIEADGKWMTLGQETCTAAKK